MNRKLKKTFKRMFLIILSLIIGFFLFLLYETQDEVNADLSTIEEKLNTFYNEKRMGGFAVSVFSADSIIYSKGFGYSDVANKKLYTKKTQQYIASISKTTIGISLMKAEELGLLNLNDPIKEHLPFKVINPKFPNKEITIKHLATHTSSLNYNEKVVESLYIDETKKSESLKPFIEDYFKNKVYGEVEFTDHVPGSNWNYSNIGAGLAAYIIEYKSGMTYSDFTEKYIFNPLGLNNTFWFESESDSTNHTNYYEALNDSIKEVKTSGVILYPCRDIITNIEDLTTYCQAIISRDSRILTKQSFEKLLSPNLSNSVTNLDDDDYGIFFTIDRNQYGIMYQLTGGSGADNCIHTIMYFDPKTELGYIFMGNTGPSEFNRVNHIWIYRTLVSLGDAVLMSNPNNSLIDKTKYKWHNWYNRVRAFF